MQFTCKVYKKLIYLVSPYKRVVFLSLFPVDVTARHKSSQLVLLIFITVSLLQTQLLFFEAARSLGIYLASVLFMNVHDVYDMCIYVCIILFIK